MLDLGAGHGGFGVEVAMLEILKGKPIAEVLTVEPRREEFDYNQNRFKSIQRLCIIPDVGDDLIRQAIEIADQSAVTAFGHDLKGVEDNSVDLLIDSWAVMLNCPTDVYPDVVREMKRVLRLGGMGIIAPFGEKDKESSSAYYGKYRCLGLESLVLKSVPGCDSSSFFNMPGL